MTLEQQSATRGKKINQRLVHRREQLAKPSTGAFEREGSAERKERCGPSLSYESAAVQNMTATALARPLRGVEHFQGNDLKNDNAGSRAILITTSER